MMDDSLESFERSVPCRHLSQWFLVKQKSNEDDTHLFCHGPRIALPESGLFPDNAVLYGWLLHSNKNKNATNSSNNTDAVPKHDAVFVRIAQLDRWFLDRSKEQRGYWISAQNVDYWLQDPCTHKPTTPGTHVSSNINEEKETQNPSKSNNSSSSSSTNSTNTSNNYSNHSKRRRQNRMTFPVKRTRIDMNGNFNPLKDANKNTATTTSSSNNLLPESNNSHEDKQLETAPKDVPNPLPSQEEVHLLHRLRLGLLSNLMDLIATRNEEEGDQIAHLSPNEFLDWIQTKFAKENDNTALQVISSSSYLNWETLRHHRYFLGEHLVFYRSPFTISCPLLMGFMQDKEEPASTTTNVIKDSSASVVKRRPRKGDLPPQKPKRKRGQPKRHPPQLEVDPPPERPFVLKRLEERTLSETSSMRQFASVVEQWSRQTSWGAQIVETDEKSNKLSMLELALEARPKWSHSNPPPPLSAVEDNNGVAMDLYNSEFRKEGTKEQEPMSRILKETVQREDDNDGDDHNTFAIDKDDNGVDDSSMATRAPRYGGERRYTPLESPKKDTSQPEREIEYFGINDMTSVKTASTSTVNKAHGKDASPGRLKQSEEYKENNVKCGRTVSDTKNIAWKASRKSVFGVIHQKATKARIPSDKPTPGSQSKTHPRKMSALQRLENAIQKRQSLANNSSGSSGSIRRRDVSRKEPKWGIMKSTKNDEEEEPQLTSKKDDSKKKPTWGILNQPSTADADDTKEKPNRSSSSRKDEGVSARPNWGIMNQPSTEEEDASDQPNWGIINHPSKEEVDIAQEDPMPPSRKEDVLYQPNWGIMNQLSTDTYDAQEVPKPVSRKKKDISDQPKWGIMNQPSMTQTNVAQINLVAKIDASDQPNWGIMNQPSAAESEKPNLTATETKYASKQEKKKAKCNKLTAETNGFPENPKPTIRGEEKNPSKGQEKAKCYQMQRLQPSKSPVTITTTKRGILKTPGSNRKRPPNIRWCDEQDCHDTKPRGTALSPIILWDSDTRSPEDVKCAPLPTLATFVFHQNDQTLKIPVQDLSQKMRKVFRLAHAAPGADRVFSSWTKVDQKKLDRGKAVIQIKVGSMSFTMEHFSALTAQDVVDCAPLNHGQQQHFPSSAIDMKPSEVLIQLGLLDKIP